MKNIIYIIGLFLCLWVGYWIGKRNNNPTEIKERITEVRDTTIIRDTIIKEIISPKYITETIIRKDTIKADTTINLIKREYLTSVNEDSIRGEIRAVVSGYNPSLDSLQYNFIIPTKEITIEREITRYKKTHLNYGVQMGFGYGVFSKKPDLFVGVGVGYSF